MSYGTLKIDTITFTDNGIDKSVSVSGLVQNPSFSGNITATGTISGNIVRGQTISGVTVTGTTAAFTTGTFISLTGTTTEGTTAAFASGVFTTQISGATITGNAAAFNTVTGGIATITSGVFASGTAAAPSVSVGTTDNGIYSPGADQVAISTNGAGRLFVDASGKLGLGTSDPGSYSASANQLVIAGSGDSGLTIRSGTANSSSIYFADGTTGSELYQGIIYYNHTNDSLNFHTNYAGSSSARMVIDSAGKVGLGTASPSSLLHLEGSDGVAQIRLQRAGTNIYGIIRQTSVPYGLTYDAVDTNTGTPTHAFRTSADGSTFSERLRITSDGKLGLGTSSPSSRLHVQDASGNAQLRITGTGGYTELYSDGNFYIQPNGSTKMVVQSGGNVGIGTSSPNANSQLHIVGSSYQPLYVNTTSPSGGGAAFFSSGTQALYVGTAGSSWLSGSSTADGLVRAEANLVLATNGNTRAVTIDSSQRVGVGTTSPAAALVVYNSSASMLFQNTATGASNSDGLFLGLNAPNGTTAYLWNYENDHLVFGTNNTERARIDSSGRLLVGTSTSIAQGEQIQAHNTSGNNIGLGRFVAAASGGELTFYKSRSGTVGTNTVVQSGDSLGTIGWFGADGTNYIQGAYIRAEVDGTPGANDMPGRLVFSTTADGASSPTERFRISNNGSMSAVIPGDSTLYPASMCRAWVNFDGTGTVAIRAAYNVSSITDNGTGDYTVNFTTAMPDANYSAVGSCSVESSELATRNVALNHKTGNTAQSTSAVRLWVSDYTSNIDRAYVNVAIFR